jgi:hypothetical protein
MTTFVPNPPIEFAQVFLRPRPRLFQRVPVVEILGFIYKFKDHEDYYEDIRRFLERMVEDVQSFFAQDMYDLSFLELGLTEGRYRIMAKGRALLEDRLRSTYSDGTGYRIHADALKSLQVKPVMDLETRIAWSGRMGYEAAALSKRIGDKVGIEVCTLGPRQH